MSHASRSTPIKGSGSKSEGNSEHPEYSEPVVFPPLMSTLDVYMEASSDLHYNQVVDKVKATKKKGKKMKKKAPQSNVVQMEPLTLITSLQSEQRPESRFTNSQEQPRQYHLRNYSASADRDDFTFDSLSLDSISKAIPSENAHTGSDRKLHISSPPPSSDRKQGRPSYTPYSPARVLVQPVGVAGQSNSHYGTTNINHNSSQVHGGHGQQQQQQQSKNVHQSSPKGEVCTMSLITITFIVHSMDRNIFFICITPTSLTLPMYTYP